MRTDEAALPHALERRCESAAREYLGKAIKETAAGWRGDQHQSLITQYRGETRGCLVGRGQVLEDIIETHHVEGLGRRIIRKSTADDIKTALAHALGSGDVRFKTDYASATRLRSVEKPRRPAANIQQARIAQRAQGRQFVEQTRRGLATQGRECGDIVFVPCPWRMSGDYFFAQTRHAQFATRTTQ